MTRSSRRQFWVLALTMLAIAWITTALGRPLQAADASRTWRDITGKFEVQAVLLKLDAESVQLRRADGSVVTVPLNRLSDEDRKYLDGLKNNNPFANPADAAAGPTDGYVLVEVQRSTDTKYIPGLLFRRDGDKAYVMIQAGSLSVNFQSRPGRPAPEPKVQSLAIIWDSAKGRKNVPAALLAKTQNGTKWIVSGPAAELPPPLSTKAESQINDGRHVKVIRWEVNTKTSPPSFARVTEKGLLWSVLRAANGKAIKMSIEGDRLAGHANALVVTADDLPLGFVNDPGLAMGTGAQGPRAEPLSNFLGVGEPEMADVELAVLSGDGKTVNYEVVVYLDDPFGRVHELQLLMSDRTASPAAGERPNRMPIHWIGPGTHQWQQISDAALTIKLTPTAPSPAVAAQLTELHKSPRGAPWVGHFSWPNPGQVERISFDVQPVYPDQDSRPYYYQPLSASVSMNRQPWQPATAASKVPGLNGRPLDATEPSQHPGGGWLLTSASTRVEKSPPYQPSLPFPQPKSNGASAVVKADKLGPYDGFQLRLDPQPANAHSWQQGPVVFSADGRWLYAVDGKDVLHKIDPARLTDDLDLELGAACNRMVLAKDGLVLSLTTTHSLWVVDPQTLTVMREIPTQELRSLVASPATSLALLKTVQQPNDPTLQVLDLATGQVVQRLKLDREHAPQVAGQPLFVDGWLSALSRDGKNFYFASHNYIQRFRLEGEEIVFEESVAPDADARPEAIALSDDGERLAVPYRSYTTILDAKHLSKSAVRLDIRFADSLAFDPKTGNLYGDDRQLFAYDPRGKVLATMPTGNDGEHRVYVNPLGERFLVWGESKVLYCDTVVGRTKPAR